MGHKKRGVSARKGKECHGGKQEESPLGSRESSVSKREDVVTSSQGMLEATIAHQGEPVLEVERLKGDAEGMSKQDTFSHEDEESFHEEQEELSLVGRLEQAEDEAKQTQGVVESRLDRLESMEGRFKVETQRVLDELEMVRGRNAQEAETFLEGLRPRVMLGEEQGDAQRLSGAIAVAGTLTELADVKPKSDVSSRPMPRDSGNNGGDREKVQRGDGIESSSSGQVEPTTVRGQGKPSEKNGKAKSGEKKKASKEKLKCYFCDGPHLIRGCPKKHRLTTIMRMMGEGEVARVGGGTSKSAKSRERLGPIDGINAAKQGARRGKAVNDEAVKPRRKPDAIANDRAIKSGARLDEATSSKVAESRGKREATTNCQVDRPGSRHAETASVKAVEHKKGPGTIVNDKAVKPRVQSEQVHSQYAKMEAWSKLRCLRHKGTLKEYVSRFRKLMLKVPNLTEEEGFFTFMFGLKPWAKRALERREVKELSKALTTAEQVEDEECISSNGREDPLNDEPDGESGDDVRSLGTSSSAEDANKPRVRAEQTRERKLKVPKVLQDYPRGAESSKVRDEPRIELSREEDEPRIQGALRLGAIRYVSAKASRSQVQETPPISEEGPNRGKSRLVGWSSYGRDALVGVLAHLITWQQEPKQAHPLWEAESLWEDCCPGLSSAATRASLGSVGENVTARNLGLRHWSWWPGVATFVLALPHDSPTFLGKAYLVAEKTEERLKRLRPHDPSDLDSDILTTGFPFPDEDQRVTKKVRNKENKDDHIEEDQEGMETQKNMGMDEVVVLDGECIVDNNGPYPVIQFADQNDYFLVKLESEQDYIHVLMEGPWTTFGSYLTVQPWSRTFSTMEKHPSQVIVWVRLLGLPYRYYSKSIFHRIAMVIGQVVKLDYSTNSGERGCFDRLAVSVNLNKLLIPCIKINNFCQKIEYEGLQQICFHCGVYRYSKESCGSAEVNTSKGGVSNDPSLVMYKVFDGEEVRFGPWMIAETRRSPDVNHTTPPVVPGAEKSKSNPVYTPRMENREKGKGLTVIGSKEVENSRREEALPHTEKARRTTSEEVIIPDGENCAGSPNFRRYLREHCQNNRLGIVALLETQIRGIIVDKVIRTLGYPNSFRVEAHGFSGACWLYFTVVYASPQVEKQELVWNHLMNLAPGVWSYREEKRKLMERLRGIDKVLLTSYSWRLVELQYKLKYELEEVLQQEESFGYKSRGTNGYAKRAAYPRESSETYHEMCNFSLDSGSHARKSTSRKLQSFIQRMWIRVCGIPLAHSLDSRKSKIWGNILDYLFSTLGLRELRLATLFREFEINLQDGRQKLYPWPGGLLWQKRVDFWGEAWLSNVGPLNTFVANQLDKYALPRRSVASMVDDNGQWKQDALGWKWKIDWCFTVKFAYNMRQEISDDSPHKVWEVISKYRGLQLIKIFLCRGKRQIIFFAIAIRPWVSGLR
ncbi:hypothetical protein F3Y22_tig00110221pilonHSYRG00110 [Hibiscus syriacus]|uniref:DUF4283 domain-containing protein n=1 Tax=Hibiscus syriacus TaxID=106335 RepID=A0A6A3B6V2_HIBSY|nr:hypothetical protein F3Y22_tig00110221pilonHSYRG00110 [Hibiscus syriacus]